MTNKPQLYILDDDEQYADMLAEMAASAGWRATALQSATTFLTSSFSKDNILVLDLVMPNIDGIEVIQALAKKNIALSIILISGFDQRVLHSAKLLAEANRMRVVASLTKPITAKAFIGALDRIERRTGSRLTNRY